MKQALIAVVAGLVAVPCRAKEGEELPGVAAYCRYVSEAASSEAALDFSPEIFAHAGYFGTSLEGFGTDTASNAPRVIAGAQMSAGHFAHGLYLRSRAQADCRRQRAMSRLVALLQAYDGPTAAPLSAKIAVLDPALTEGRATLANLKAATRDGRATLEELNSAQLRFDALSLIAADAHRDLESLNGKPQPPHASVSDLLRERQDAEHEMEIAEGNVREAPGWDVTLRGGYDRTFDQVGTQGFFGMVSLSLNPGRFFQGVADDRAAAARREWAAGELGGPYQTVELLVQRLRATLKEEQARLTETRTLVAELESRLNTAEGMGSRTVRSYREGLWFDAVRGKADLKFLEAHVADLEAVLK